MNKSKLLLGELSALLLMGMTVNLTIILSNSQLDQSKSRIVNNGNPSDLTISIPDSIREASIAQSGDAISVPTDSPVDKELQAKLDSLNLGWSITKTIGLSDVQTNSNFTVYQADNFSEVNHLVSNNNIDLPTPKVSFNDLNLYKDTLRLFNIMYNLQELELNNIDTNNPDLVNHKNYLLKVFDYDYYINSFKPWHFIHAMLSGVWNLASEKIKPIVEIMQNLGNIPKDKNDYDLNYNLYPNGSLTPNKNSYWYRLRFLMNVSSATFNGYGFNIAAKQVLSIGGPYALIPFNIQYYDPSSFMAIVSPNYMNANPSKKSIPYETLVDILQLPFANNSNESSLNPSSQILVHNPLTGIKEPFSSFNDWLNVLPNDFKIYINSSPYIIIDQGITPDMLYPVTNPDILIVDSKTTGVIYVNQSGFNRSSDGVITKPELYYSVRYPPDIDLDIIRKNNLFNEISGFTVSKYGKNTAFLVSDPNQPNRLINIRSTFLNNLQNIILIVGLIFGLIIGFLTLFFVATLIRSIIKQNKITLGVGIANGIKKWELALSLFPFALIPAIICGILSYIISYFLTGPLNNVISQYWTLPISQLTVQWWIFPVVILLIFVILFILIILVTLWTLRKKTQVILNSSGEFRMNWLIIHSKKFTSLFGAFGSFRITYMMGNVMRFCTLTFIVFLFTTLLSFTVGTLDQFSIAQSYNTRNKKYTYAFDLYSPTINSGYYSAMPYDQIGTTQQGMYNNYTRPEDPIYDNMVYYSGNYDTPLTSTGGFYSGYDYANALSYPYASNLYYTSLFLPNTSLAAQLNSNIHFFNEKVFIKPVLDVELDIVGAPINPWSIAKDIMPQNILNLANNLFQKQIEINKSFFIWLQEQNKLAINNQPSQKIEGVDSPYNGSKIYYSTYLPNINQQPFTDDGSDIIEEFNDANNKQHWYFKKIYNISTNNQEWVLNQDISMNSAPSYTIKPRALQLIILMMSNSSNPLFQYWYKNIYSGNPGRLNPNQTMPEFSYKVGYGVVPVEYDDETYTYIESIINKSTLSISNKIIGIKTNSKYVNLYDENNISLNNLLENKLSDGSYPLIINDVVEKLYGLKVNDKLSVEAKNIFDRFSRINYNRNPAKKDNQLPITNKVNFTIIGKTNTKNEIQFYTSQTFANEILGYGKFDNPSKKWNGPNDPGYGYIPFNGVYTNQQLPKMFYNYGGIYSPSGLNSSKGIWNTNIGNGPGQVPSSEIASVLNNNSAILSFIVKLQNYVDYDKDNSVVTLPGKDIYSLYPANYNPMNYDDIGDTVRNIVNIFGTEQPVIAQIQNIDTTLISATDIYDSTLNILQTIILICMIPTLTIIIILLASMIISESTRLVALMKVLGISNAKNAFSFMFVYWVVLFLGVILAIPLSIGLIELMKSLVFSGFQIIVTPIAPWWIFIVSFGIIGFSFGLLYLYILAKLKKLNPAQVIASR